MNWQPGSPPLVRERLKETVQDGKLIRITPARAGKTSTSAKKPLTIQDHPRSCGKDIPMRTTKMAMLGSPPLVRERPRPPAGSAAQPGITPARAGKTALFEHGIDQCRDHPRSCGKDGNREQLLGTLQGSPPLVRERPWQPVSLRRSFRITPARAGKTHQGVWIRYHGRDHPRSCGKDLKKGY